MAQGVSAALPERARGLRRVEADTASQHSLRHLRAADIKGASIKLPSQVSYGEATPRVMAAQAPPAVSNRKLEQAANASRM